MITCQECGASVSTAAAACPNCGAGKKAMTGRRRLGCWAWLGLVILGLSGISAVTGLILGGGAPPDGNSGSKGASDNHPYIGQAVEDTTALKQSLRDPDSLVLESVGASTTKHLTCIVYRARNGFGGMNRDAVAITDRGAITSPARVRHLCHGKGFEALTRFVSSQVNG